MATTTTNYGWDIPQSTDLVKDGATAIATLGQDIDTTFVDLKGGTTGQILSKASNTDNDYTWITPNPGDITGVTAGTGITGGGTSGDVTVSFDIANYGGGQYAAGKNKIINGDMGIWQRGTSFAASASTSPFTADRWQTSIGTGAAATISQQAFTAGAAPVAGYESAYFLRFARTTTGSTPCYLYQKIEDVRTLAGQTATVSFWAKAASTYTFAAGEIYLEQTWGTGGTAGSVVTSVNTSSQTISTSWNRYSFTVAVPATTGKTIGTSSSLALVFNFATGQGTSTFDIWGVQIEAGSTATPFQTATGTKQGELAACQRYFYRYNANGTTGPLANGGYYTSTNFIAHVPMKQTMRTTPSLTVNNATNFTVYSNGSSRAATAVALDIACVDVVSLSVTTSTATGGNAGAINAVNTNASIDFSSEL